MADDSAKSITERFKTDPTARAKFVADVKELMKKHGVPDADLHRIDSAENEGSEFWVSTSDGRKNSSSVYFP